MSRKEKAYTAVSSTYIDKFKDSTVSVGFDGKHMFDLTGEHMASCSCSETTDERV